LEKIVFSVRAQTESLAGLGKIQAQFFCKEALRMLVRREVAPLEAQQILVVDDNRDGAQMLAMVLRYAGHEVSVAYDGHEALQLAREQRPRVILLDIGMPRMDGYTVARRLRDEPETKNSLIIAVSGYGLPGDKARAKAAGMNFHFLKPVDKDLLLDILRAVPSNALMAG
jgi:two-component system OmpR family response regulator